VVVGSPPVSTTQILRPTVATARFSVLRPSVAVRAATARAERDRRSRVDLVVVVMVRTSQEVIHRSPGRKEHRVKATAEGMVAPPALVVKVMVVAVVVREPRG
jgi:hypothetical protein